MSHRYWVQWQECGIEGKTGLDNTNWQNQSNLSPYSPVTSSSAINLNSLLQAIVSKIIQQKRLLKITTFSHSHKDEQFVSTNSRSETMSLHVPMFFPLNGLVEEWKSIPKTVNITNWDRKIILRRIFLVDNWQYPKSGRCFHLFLKIPLSLKRKIFKEFSPFLLNVPQTLLVLIVEFF